MLALFTVNEQKQEIVDFIRNTDGTVKHFRDEDAVSGYRDQIHHNFKSTTFVFDTKEGEVIDWFE